jgi:uncharacterized protein (TIGR00725 family)
MTQPVVAVFGASKSLPGDDSYEQGVRCGELLADGGYAVATGGYGGVMEAVSRGARSRGGRVLGITAPEVFRNRPGANEFLTEEWRASHLTERIHELTDVSVASITLPGSLGTLTELAVAWNLAHVAGLGSATAKPVITVGSQWSGLVEHLAATLEANLDLVTRVDTVEEAVRVLGEKL